jgi:hypothetical protein
MSAPYQSQLGVSGGPVLSGADPEAFGAAVGRGLEQAGETIDRSIHLLREKNRDSEAAAAGVALAQASTSIDNQATDARDAAEPGAAGHTETIVKSIDDVTAQNLGSIKDPHIRAAFAERYAELKDRVGTREYGWEATQRVGKLVTDVDQQGTQYANAQASSPNVGSFVQSLHDVATTVGALTMPGDMKEKITREQQRKIAVAFANSLQDKDPHSLIETLDKGTLNAYLEPEDIRTLRSGGDVEIRRLEAAARQKRSQEEADARERISVLGKRIGAGDYSISDNEFKAAADDAKKYGLEGPGFDLADWKDKRDVVRETRDWTPGQWHSAINELAAKGDKLTTPESVRLNHLRELGGPAVDRFNSDPFAAAANAGNAAPDVDWTNPDPAAVQKRVSWARSYAQASGLQNVPYLSNDELKAVRDRVGQGPVGQLEVAADLRKSFGVAVGTEVAKQVDRNDKGLQLMIGLVPQAAELYRKGIDALQRNPKLFAGGEGDADRAREIFNEYAVGIPPELRTPVLNVARGITAAAGDTEHRSSLEGDEFEATFRAAIHRAAGAIGVGDKQTGGFVNWMGRRAWLPPTMGQREFQQRLSRAGPNEWKQAAGGSPPYYMGPNGKLVPLSDDQIKRLGSYTLDSVSPGVYQPLGADGHHLVDKNGQVWSFDVRKLGH